MNNQLMICSHWKQISQPHCPSLPLPPPGALVEISSRKALTLTAVRALWRHVKTGGAPGRAETRAPPFQAPSSVLTPVLLLSTTGDPVNKPPASVFSQTLRPRSRPTYVTTSSSPPPPFQLSEIEFLYLLYQLVTNYPSQSPRGHPRTPPSIAIITKHVPIYPQLPLEFLPLLLTQLLVTQSNPGKLSPRPQQWSPGWETSLCPLQSNHQTVKGPHWSHSATSNFRENFTSPNRLKPKPLSLVLSLWPGSRPPSLTSCLLFLISLWSPAKLNSYTFPNTVL